MPLLLALLLCGAPALAGESTITLAAPGALFPKQVKPCVLKTSDGWREPSSLDALLDCQAKVRGSWIQYYRDQKGDEPPAAALDKLDDYQRAEARAFTARHPDLATTASAPDAPEASSAAAAPVRSGAAKTAGRRRCAPPAAGGAAPTGALAAQEERTAAAMDANDQKVDPGTASDLDALNSRLVADSKNGAAGITPDSARAIADYLQCEQGGVSPDMQSLLDHLSRDGGKLSDQSMVELKQAARAAKDAGLELGVDQQLEGWLLDPTTDPRQQAPGAL